MVDCDCLAEEFVQVHYEYARILIHFMDILSSTGENGVLYKLYKSDNGLTPSELAKHLGLSSGRLANILKQLEGKKYISRMVNAKDRRSSLITLTPKGRDNILKIYQYNLDVHKRIFEHFTDEELEEFRASFAKLFEIAKAIEDIEIEKS